MTDDQVATIRHLRGHAVSLKVVAKTLQATIPECRPALGLPTSGTPERQTMPWDVVQRTLFDSK